jgi:MerR family transcriptional regulator, light-induced transcriptional regulator
LEGLKQRASEMIEAQRQALAHKIVERQYALQPELAQRYGAAGREKCLQDAHYHLTYLAEAVAVGSTPLFADYVQWAKILLGSYGVPAQDLAANLQVIRETLQENLPEDIGNVVGGYIDRGLESLQNAAKAQPSYIEQASSLTKDYLEALLRCDRRTARQLVLDAVAAGVNVRTIYTDVFQQSQYEIGRLWQMNQISVAQEHFCTAATQMIMSELYPYILSTPKKGLRFVGTAVGGELHEIGIRMIADFLELEGWDTIYLGANTPAPSIIRTLGEIKPHVLGISATMTFHISKVASLIAAVRASEAGKRVKIVVGGRPFNVDPNLWRQVGADGYAASADALAVTAIRLMSEGSS